MAGFLADLGIVNDVIDPHEDEAFVLVDLTDEVSEAGDDRPEDISEKDGLSGRVLDSEIQ